MKSLVIGDQEFEGNHDFSKASVVITTDLQEGLININNIWRKKK